MKRFRRSRPLDEQAKLFWQRVNCGKPQDCWEWTGAINSTGYGAVRYDGKARSTHRVAWLLTHKSLPVPPLIVLHRCDNRPCCNPSHLFLGTAIENSLDMSGKNRAPLTNATFTEKTAQQAVDLVRSGLFNQSEVGRMYGVSRQNMCNLMAGRCWPQVTGIRSTVITPSWSKPKGAPARRTSEEKTAS